MIFQAQVRKWMLACFGETIAQDRTERTHRFLEEALELAQANGCTHYEAIQLVDYTFNRPVGEVSQEVGGVMITLAALCEAGRINMMAEAESELRRVWLVIEKIRAKQASKPKFGPLPSSVTTIHPDKHTQWMTETWETIQQCADTLNEPKIPGTPRLTVVLSPQGCAAMLAEHRALTVFAFVPGDKVRFKRGFGVRVIKTQLPFYEVTTVSGASETVTADQDQLEKVK